MAALRSPSERECLRRAVREDEPPGAGYTGLLRHGRFERVVLLHVAGHPELRGLTVAAVASRRGADPLETYLDLIVEEDDEVVGIFDYIDEDDIRTLLRSPVAMVSSDGLVMPSAGAPRGTPLYWPCSYGEYPGILERYVRDEEVLRLEEAIRKMTSFPAQRFRLFDRGALRPGLRADLVVFDLERIRDRATNRPPHRFPFENIPHRHPEGIDWVIVNGEPVVADGEPTGARPGRLLRRR
jgi:N-acyl-D-aspartate/D-glutamate deacylase